MIPYWYLPTLHLGPIPINTWGFLVSIGFAAAIYIAYSRVKRLGLDGGKIVDVSFWVIVAALFGARLGHVFFYEWGYYSQHLNEIIRIDHGGLSSYGGFTGAVIVFFVYKRKFAGSFWHYADSLMFAFPLGWAIGRIGCFLIHDHPGRFTDFVLGVQYPNGVRHDLGLYEMFSGLALFLLFLLLYKQFSKKPGMFVVVGAFWYGIARFFLDFLRIGDARYWDLTPAQYGSVALVVIGVYLWYHKYIWAFRRKYN